MLPYEPITNASTFTNQFGVPTAIIGTASVNSNLCSPTCTGSGGTGTYAVNWSQTIASSSFITGMYNELIAGTETATGSSSWKLNINAESSTNPLTNMAVVFKSDLLAYFTGQFTSPLYKLRMQQANFAIVRDLSYGNVNVANTTTWSTRRPAAYYSYSASEMRSSLFACSYGFYNGTTPCQTSYALNGSSNDYSVSVGTAVDKMTLCVQWSTTTTNSTVTFSSDNGTTKYPIVSYQVGGVTTNQIVAAHITGLVFDATLGDWISTEGTGTFSSNSCLSSGGPPEAFVQAAQETGTTPSIVEPPLAADPITDYSLQYSLLIKNFQWNKTPTFSIVDEPWNCNGQGTAIYASAKSAAYVGLDTTWASNRSGHGFCGSFSNGDFQNWAGKAASLLAQVIRKVSNSYVVVVGVQTAGNANSQWNAELLSNSYVGQNTSDLPLQSGCAGVAAIQTDCPAPFTQTAAYQAMQGATSASAGIEIANYWGLVDQQGTAADNAAEVALAACYYNQYSGCASPTSIMSTYMATQSITNTGNVPSIVTLWSNWYSFAQNCAGGSGCSPMSIYNYEGGYSVGTISSDYTASITAATNASNAVLSVNPNGCVANQTVGFSNMTGGTWSTLNSTTATVVSANSTTCTVSVSGSGLGTLSSGTLTYTGSTAYVNVLRNNSFLAPNLGSLTTLLFNTIASTTAQSACFPAACSFYPSALQLTGSFYGNTPWFLWQNDLYGYFEEAACTACTAASSVLTLGGAITGVFASGQTLMGGAISGATITGTCSTSAGPLPAGANSGDTCPISNSSTVTSHAFTGNIAPPTNAAGNSTTSPVLQWNATCAWSGNGGAC